MHDEVLLRSMHSFIKVLNLSKFIEWFLGCCVHRGTVETRQKLCKVSACVFHGMLYVHFAQSLPAQNILFLKLYLSFDLSGVW